MSAMTFTEDNCGTYPPSYPQRESLRLQRYNKLINYARVVQIKMPFMRNWHKWQMILKSIMLIK